MGESSCWLVSNELHRRISPADFVPHSIGHDRIAYRWRGRHLRRVALRVAGPIA